MPRHASITRMLLVAALVAAVAAMPTALAKEDLLVGHCLATFQGTPVCTPDGRIICDAAVGKCEHLRCADGQLTALPDRCL